LAFRFAVFALAVSRRSSHPTFKSDLLTIAGNSEKGKLLSVGKDDRACSQMLRWAIRHGSTGFRRSSAAESQRHFSLIKISLWAQPQPATGSFNPALERGDSMDVVLKNWRVLAIAALAFPFAGSASLAGDTLYAADNLTNFPASGIVQVDTGSLLETGDFLTSGAIAGVATDGTDVFVSLPTGISEYTTAGAFVGSFMNNSGDSFGALALSGDTLYAADNLTNFPASGIVQVDTGSLLETGDFLTSGAIAGVATDGTDVFVSLPTGISEYTTAGAFVGSFMNNSGDSFGALALASSASPAVPEAPTWAMMALGFASLSFAGYWRTRMRSASSGSNSAATA
jgi:hypothetical protein